MHSDNEDLITFIISLNTFKYKVLLFSFTNGSAFYQQYINKILFDFFNYFVQVYLNDILIYSRTYKEHVNYIHSVLEKF